MKSNWNHDKIYGRKPANHISRTHFLKHNLHLFASANRTENFARERADLENRSGTSGRDRLSVSSASSASGNNKAIYNGANYLHQSKGRKP